MRFGVIAGLVALLLGGVVYGAVALYPKAGKTATASPSPAPGVSKSEQAALGDKAPASTSVLQVTQVIADEGDFGKLLAKALQITGEVSLAGNLTVGGTGTFGGPVTAVNFVGSGAGLTGVNADLLAGHNSAFYTNASNLQGTIPDAKLSANVALRNSPNVFSAANTFSGGVTATGSVTLTGPISASGPITISGPASLTGTTTISSLILSAPLSVGSGGTGLATIPVNGVVFGQGAANVGVAVPAASGQCLISTLTSVQFGSCSGSGGSGVSSLDTLVGDIVLANSTGVGSLVTINDASTATKGIAQFNATNFSVVGGVVNTAQNLAVSSSPTFAGLSLTAPLTVANGGLGTGSLASNGVVVGQGTGALTAVTAGAAGQCLVSTAGAPSFQACPGTGGVSSVNAQTGVLTIANAGAAAGTITINDASTVAKGIAQFNNTNFSVAGGVVNTIQNLAVGSTPTFAGLSLTSALTIGNGGTGATSAGGARTNLGAAASGANGDITSLSGLTTALSVAQGGTGVTSGANGQILIGTGAGLSLNTLSAGAGVNIVNGSGTITISAPSSGSCASCANTSLSNLASVALNTSLLPVSAGSANLGSGVLPFGQLALAGTSGSPATNNFLITGASTSGMRTITLPDASGTVAVSASGNIALDPTTGAISFTGLLPIASGGTGSGTAGGARTNLGAAASGANSDITSLSALSTALSVGQGGTGVTTAANGQLLIGTGGGLSLNTLTAGAGVNIVNASGSITISAPGSGSCGSCANTSLSNLGSVAINTSLLPGTAGAVDLGSVALPFGNLSLAGTSSTPATNNFLITGTSTGGTRTITLPDGSGTVAVSATGPLALDAAGNLTCPTCLTSGGGGAGGVSSVNTATGALIIQGVSAGSVSLAGSTITINDATSAIKGLAKFNATNLTVASGSVNTVQDITVGSTPTFASQTLTGAGSLTLGTAGANTGSARFYNGTGGATGSVTLSAANPVAGNYTLTLPAETGTVCSTGSVCTGYAPATGGSGYIQLQSSTPGTAQTGNFNISGTGIAGLLQAASFDTASAGILAIGGTNATTVTIANNAAAHTVSIAAGAAVQAVTVGSTTGASALTLRAGSGGIGSNAGSYSYAINGTTVEGIDSTGRVTFQPVGDSSYAFTVRNSAGTIDPFKVDTSNSTSYVTGTLNVSGIGANIYSAGQIVSDGPLTLQGTSATNFHTPGTAGDGSNGVNIPTKINIPFYDPGAFGQILAMGLPSTADATARVITVLDARTTAHQPSIGVVSPNETDIAGFSWDGTNTDLSIRTNTSASNIALAPDGNKALKAYNSGSIGIGIYANTLFNTGDTLEVGAYAATTVAANASNNDAVLRVQGAAGAATTGTSGNLAGNGSYVNISTGDGGAATGASGANVAGSGGTVLIQSGNGGNVTSGTGTSGSGGNILLIAGGAGTGGTSGKAGSVLIQTIQSSATAFQVQTNAGYGVLTVDTGSKTVVLGSASHNDGALTFNNVSNSHSVLITSGATTGDYTAILPVAVGSVSQCVSIVSKPNSVDEQLGYSDCALTTDTTNFIRNQTSVQASSNFNITGTGIAAFLQAGGLDTPIPEALDLGFANATSIKLDKTTTSNSPLTVNNVVTVNSNVTAGASLNVKGSIELFGMGGGNLLAYTTPLGNSITTALGLDTYDPGFGNAQIATGIPAGASANANGILAYDGRAGFHQPTIGVVNPNETETAGLTWDGSNSIALFKTNNDIGTNTPGIGIKSGDVSGGSGRTTGAVYLQSGDGFGTNTSSGNIVIDSGAKTGSGTTGTISVGTTNASAVSLGNASGTFQVASSGGLNVSTGGALTGVSTIATSGTINGQTISSAANFTGTLQVATSLLTSLIDTPSGTTTLNIGTTNATSGINLNQNTTVTGSHTLNVGGLLTVGGINASNGGISNSGAIGGVTTLGVGGLASFTGNSLLQPATNSASALLVQNNSGNNVFSVDTSGNSVILGKSSAINGALVFANAANGNTVTVTSATTGNGSLTLPAETGTLCSTGSVCAGYSAATGGAGYIQNQNSVTQTADFKINGTGTADTFSAGTALQSSGTISATGTPAASAAASLLQLGSAIAQGSASGNYIGVNSGSTFAGNLAELEKGGSAVYSFGANSTLNIGKVAPTSTTNDWAQSSTSGFGSALNITANAFGVFNGKLYTAMQNNTTGDNIYSSSDGTSWTQVNTAGFGSAANNEVTGFVVFNGALYTVCKNAGGSTVFRTYDGTTWTQVNTAGFGSANNNEIFPPVVFEGKLYVGTTNTVAGAQIWATADGTTWSQMNTSGFGSTSNIRIRNLIVYNGSLYAGTYNATNGGQVWVSTNGTSWAQSGSNGLGSTANIGTYSMGTFKGALYVGMANSTTGTTVFRTYDGSTWTQVVSLGYGLAGASFNYGLITYNGNLYSGTGGTTSEIMETSDGVTWTQVNTTNFGNVHNGSVKALQVFNGALYIGTNNATNGGQVWSLNMGGVSDTTGNITVGGAQIGTVQIEGGTISGVDKLAVNNFSAGTAGVISLQVAGGAILLNDPASAYSVTLSTPSLTANRAISLPDASGTVALTSDTTDFIRNQTGLQSSSNFNISGTGTIGTALVAPAVRPAADSTSAFKIQNAAGSTDILKVDTTNGRVGIGLGAGVPAYALDVSGTTRLGQVNSAGALSVINNSSYNLLNVDTNANVVGLGEGGHITGKLAFATSAGANTISILGPVANPSGNYTLTIPAITANDTLCAVALNNCSTSSANVTLSNLTNPTAINQDLTFANAAHSVTIAASGAGAVGQNLSIVGGASGTGAVNGGNLVLQAGATGGSGTTGSVIVKANGTNSTTAFQIQTASATSLFTADTSNSLLNIAGSTTVTSASGSFPSTSVLDNFNRANGGLGANWTGPIAGDTNHLTITSNAVTSAGATDGGDAWNTPINSPNIETYVTTATAPTGWISLDIASNPTSSTFNGYAISITGGSMHIDRIDSGVTTTIQSKALGLSNGDSIGMTRVGNQVNGWFKPAAGSWTQFVSASDTTYNVTGYYIGLESANNAVRFDDFGGGVSTTGAGFNVNGTQLLQTLTNSTTAFQVQNASGSAVFGIDTTNGEVGIGTNAPNRTLTVAPPSNATAIVGIQSTGGAGGEIDLGYNGGYQSSIGFNRAIGGAIELAVGGTTFGTPQTGGKTALTLNGDGSLLSQNNTNSTTAFQIQNSVGTSILNVGTTPTTNLISNGGFEVNTTGWLGKGTGAISRITTQQFNGAASMQVITSTTGDGAKFAVSLSAATTYTYSVEGKASGANFGTFETGYSFDGSTDTICAPAKTLRTSGWFNINCTFTTPGGSPVSTYVYLKQTDATGRTFYIDAAQMVTGSNIGAYGEGTISTSGVFTTPVAIQATSDSGTAFQVQTASGISLFGVDSARQRVGVGTLNAQAQLQVLNVNSAATPVAIFEGAASQSGDILQLQDNSANTLFSASSAGDLVFSNGTHSISAVAQSAVNTVGSNLSIAASAGNGSGNGGNLVLQAGAGGGTGVSGSVVVKANGSNTSSAFQIQNSSGSSLFTVDTTLPAANLITNGELETNGTGWVAKGTASSFGRNVLQAYHGTGSLQFLANGSGDGAKYNVTLANSTTYTATLLIKTTTSNTSSFAFGYAFDGANEATFLDPSISVETGHWLRYEYTFTTGTVSGTPYFFAKTTSAGVRAFYIDSVSIVAGTAGGSYMDGALKVNGTVTSPIGFQNSEDSNAAFAINDSTNGRILTVDTVNDTVGIGSTGAVSTAKLNVMAASTTTVIRGNSTGSGSLLDLQNNGSTVLNVSNAGKLSVTAQAAPTTDQVSITNDGQADVTGINGLHDTYVGGAAAVEGSGLRVDFTPGGTTGGTWNGLSIAAASTGAASGVDENGIKLVGPSSPGVGTETAINITTGWDIGIAISSGGIQMSSTGPVPSGAAASTNEVEPSSPSGTDVKVYSQTVDGRPVIKVLGSGESTYALQSSLFSHYVCFIGADVFATSTNGFGCGRNNINAVTPVNNPTVTEQSGGFSQYNSVSANSNDTAAVGMQTIGQTFYRGSVSNASNGFFFATRLYFPDASYATNTRFFTGLASESFSTATTGVMATDNPTDDRAGFGWSTVRGDTNFQFTTKDGTTENLANTSMAFTAQHVYEFYIYTPKQGTTIYWRIDDITAQTTESGSVTSHLPTNSTALRIGAAITNTSSGTVHKLGYAHLYAETDR